MPLSSVELKSEHAGQSDEGNVPPHVASDRDFVKSHMRVVPMLITLGAVAVAALLARATWQGYFGAPWTRDGTVAAYGRTHAPAGARRNRQPPGPGVPLLPQRHGVCL